MAETMRAVVIREFGGAEVLEVRDVERPVPAPGEALVRVVASGVNRADVLQRMGRYPAPEGVRQDVPGLEFAGTVEALARGDAERPATPGAADPAVGDAVMGLAGGAAYAEYVAVAAETLVRVPAGVDLREAAAVPEAFMTAFDAVFLQEGLAAGETLLVHAAGSGVGTAAIQLARAAGARTVGTSRTPDKLERASALGLDVAVLADEHWPERVLEATGGRGADVILDLVGGAYLADNQRVLAPRGRHVVVGTPAGVRAEIDLGALMRRRGSIRGTVLRARSVEEKAALARAFEERVLPWLAEGRVRPIVDRTFAPGEAPEAHRVIEDNRTFGKVLLVW